MTRLAAALVVLALTSSAAELSPEERKIVQAVDADRAASNALLERLVNLNSGTLNAAGVRRVADVLRPEFAALGFEVRWIPMDQVHRAGHLVAERHGDRGKRVLLIGHMDTVFEPDSPFQKFERDSEWAKGPGSSDMKGGLAIILSALKALHGAGALAERSITVVLTGDEEKPGEPLSIARRDLIEAAKRNDVAIEFEGGTRSEGREFATIARRSSSIWHLRATGNTGHSAGVFNPEIGSGAIYEMARILTGFHEQLKEPDLTYNASVMVGGSTVEYEPKENRGSAAGKTNIIPDKAFASGDIRTISAAQLERVRAKMRRIVEQHLPGTSAEISFEEGYPAMEATAGNQRLLALLNTVNRDLNLETMEAYPPARRGAGDVSFAAPFLDSISGLGSFGRNAHVVGEAVDLSRQAAQAKRTAVLIYRLTH